MSEFNHSDHIRTMTDKEYLSRLDPAQRLAYMSFYLMATHPNLPERESSLRELWNDRPAARHQLLLHTMYKTAEKTLFIVGSTQMADENVENNLLVAAELRDNDIIMNELEIVRVAHPHQPGIPKIIDAKWHETSRLTSLHITPLHSYVQHEQHGHITFSPLEPVVPFHPLRAARTTRGE